MSLLYTSKEFDQETCLSYRILGFRIFVLFSGSHKTPILEDTKLVLLLTRYLLLSIRGLDLYILTQIQKTNKNVPV